MSEVITEQQWQAAYDHLQECINIYAGIPTGTFALNITLFPLRVRYLKGERTAELYNEMREVE